MQEPENRRPEAEEEFDFAPDLITLEDEDGKSYEFEIVGSLEQDGEQYMALIPVPQNAEELLEDAGELLVLRVNDEDNSLEAIEDEQLFDKIAAIFVEQLSDEFEFEDAE